MALRVGFIGAGANTRLWHIPQLAAQEGVELAAVVNRSRESSQRIVDEFGIPRVHDSVAELLADTSLDAVCIGTWPYMHREYTVAALNAGKHVLCEARMAMNAAEAEEMLAASRANPSLVAQLVPAPFDFRLGPTIMRRLRDGTLGEVTEATIAVLNGAGLDPAAPLHWRHRTDYSGRNVMMLGIYAEIVLRWLGETARVMADGAIVVPERLDPESGEIRAVDVPDTFSVLARMRSGVRVTYHLSSVTAGAPFNGIVVHGTKATLQWRPNDRATITPHGGAAEELEPDQGTDRGWRVEHDFVDSIRNGAPVTLTNFPDGVRYMRFIDACWRSWQEGKAMEVAPLG